MQYKEANQLRFSYLDHQGHYESYFLRANHPTKKQAFWLRYTLFSSKDKTLETAEIWGAFFDKNEVIAIQQDISLNDCNLDNSQHAIELGSSYLKFAHSGSGSVKGKASDKNKNMSWNINYQGEKNTALLLPETYYKKALPKAKVLVGIPQALFNGTISINRGDSKNGSISARNISDDDSNEIINIENWQGSENHNWGSKHTDEYAWGQVCGFDNEDNSFLECSTARIKLGPLWSPRMSLAILRVNEKEYRFNGLWQAIKNKGSYQYFDWHMHCRHNDYSIEIKMGAKACDIAGLSYRNPPGGNHTCLNSKVASCVVTLKYKGNILHRLITKHRAAFEILTDDNSHGVTIQNSH